MTDFKDQAKERISRQQAAERLIDIAYALTAGGQLELKIGGERVHVAVADHLLFARGSSTHDNHVELSLELSWSDPEAKAFAPAAPEPLT